MFGSSSPILAGMLRFVTVSFFMRGVCVRFLHDLICDPALPTVHVGDSRMVNASCCNAIFHRSFFGHIFGT